MAFSLELRLDPTTAAIEEDAPLDPRPGLSLSGGGYRAMLFHVGAIWRLNELAFLPKLGRVSSVSGGSITAGALGLAWKQLGFDASGVAADLEDAVVDPLRLLASRTTDIPAVLMGAALPGVDVSDRVEAAYREHLFGDATLQRLPADGEGPRFVLNATSVQTGALFRFSQPYMADYHVGRFLAPDVPLAKVVAASSAFPPFLSPATLPLTECNYEQGSGDDAYAEFRERAVLTDGGVYDNLGLETVWKRHAVVLVSDGGGAMPADESPAHDWVRHVVRVLGIIDNQVRSLRRRMLIGAFEAKLRHGTYWGIRSDIAKYPAAGGMAVSPARSLALANVPTRLARLDDALQDRIINWGYAVCDAAMRSHVLEPGHAAPPPALPYPGSGI